MTCQKMLFSRIMSIFQQKFGFKMIKNDFFAKCLDCLLTTHKMKKKTRKKTSPIISKQAFYKKKASLKIYQSPQFSRYLYKILTAGSLDHFYVKLVLDLRNFNFLIFNCIFSKFLRKNLEKIRLKIKK